MLNTRRTIRGERGASLLEVLVSILILSFGMLAMAGLHAVSIQQGKMSQFRGTAMQLAVDLADRMRANRGAFAAAPSPYVFTQPYNSDAPAVAVPACTMAACTPAQRADADLAEWRNLARNALPGGGLFVTQVPGTNTMDIWVLWVDPNAVDTEDGAAGMASDQHCPEGLVVAALAPQCLQLRVTI